MSGTHLTAAEPGSIIQQALRKFVMHKSFFFKFF